MLLTLKKRNRTMSATSIENARLKQLIENMRYNKEEEDIIEVHPCVLAQLVASGKTSKEITEMFGPKFRVKYIG